MFNFFHKKIDDTIKSDIVASITYLIKQDKSGPIIDVQLGDDDNESIEALCSILDVLGSDMFYIDTINMIKVLLTQSHQEELLIKILTRVSDDVRKKILASKERTSKDEPCIKPSDMLR